MTDFNLTDCLDRVKRRDPQAAHDLVGHLYPLVIRIIRSHLPKRTQEEDLAQEVFMKLFARLEQYQVRAGVPFEHWVSRLAVRTCLDGLRAEQRRPELRWTDLSEAEAAWLDFMLATDATAPETTALDSRHLLEKIMEPLDPKDRLLINLLDLQGKSVRETSQITGWSVSRVKVRAFRVRKKLQKIAAALKKQGCYE